MQPKRITVVFEEAEDLDGWWVVHSPQLPGVLTQGEGLADAIGMFKEAYELMEEGANEDGYSMLDRPESGGPGGPR